MVSIYFTISAFALLFVLMYYSSVKPALESPSERARKQNVVLLYCLLAGALIARLVIAATVSGYETDINCFKAWANIAYSGGLQNFYHAGTFTDYPPGYIYILWLLGGMQSWFNLDVSSTAYLVLLKLPAILCDILTAYLIYRVIKKYANHAVAISLSGLYAFNPAILINSAAWGQVDSVYALFVFLFIYFLIERKLILSCIFYTIGFIIKPQTIIFTPVLLFGIYHIVFGTYSKIQEQDKAAFRAKLQKGLYRIAIAAGASLAILFVLLLPFAKGFDFYTIYKVYTEALKSYPYASVNAFNLFALFGGNWKNIFDTFIIFSYNTWSTIFIVLNVVVATWIFFRHKGRANLFLLGALIITTMFVTAGKMHERYVFPAIPLLLAAFAIRRDTRCLWLYGALSVTQFINTGSILYQAMVHKTTAAPDGPIVPLVALANIAILGFLIYIAYRGDKETQKPLQNATKNTSKPAASKPAKAAKASDKKPQTQAFTLKKSAAPVRLSKWDYIIMAAVILVYSSVALFNLGGFEAPQTYWNGSNPGDGFVIELPSSNYVHELRFFTGVSENRKVNLRTGAERAGNIEWSDPSTIELGYVFAWHNKPVQKTIKYLEITATQAKTCINEIALMDRNGEKLSNLSVRPVGANGQVTNLIDEQDTVPAQISYRNSTYFDEIYHARTAYEYLNSMWPYENTHPPLGKVLISWGIAIFGMVPFGWRIIGTLFGIFMLPAIYIFAKKMFAKTSVPAVAMILFAADFMHFAQTRIATIDVYITFFIILMYLFMYIYTTMSFYDTPFYKTLIPLALSGLCMGLGIASKWTGVYAGIGLAVIFFISLGRRWYERNKILADKNSSKEDKAKVAVCGRYTLYTLLWCVLFFVIIPAGIYAASYIPFVSAPGARGIQTILENQKTMFNYHAHLNATHPFSSPWYEWPIIYKPIWFYSGTNNSLKESIASFGNPFIWWAGLAAFLGVIVIGIIKKDRRALFLVIGYLSQYLPWVGVTRIVFIYHYFTCVPFIILMLAYIANWLYERYPYHSSIAGKAATWGVWAYIAACVVLFAVFYPVLSGYPVPSSYIDGLKWFKSWIF